MIRQCASSGLLRKPELLRAAPSPATSLAEEMAHGTASSSPPEMGTARLVSVPMQLLFATDVNLGAGLVTTGKGVQAINSSRLGSICFMWAES